MDYTKPLEADNFIELTEHPIQIAYDIIAGIMNVTGIQADGQALVMFDFIDDGGNLLKAAADLRSFACHRLKGDMNFRLVRTAKHFIQAIGNPLNTVFCILVGKSPG